MTPFLLNLPQTNFKVKMTQLNKNEISQLYSSEHLFLVSCINLEITSDMIHVNSNMMYKFMFIKYIKIKYLKFVWSHMMINGKVNTVLNFADHNIAFCLFEVLSKKCNAWIKRPWMSSERFASENRSSAQPNIKVVMHLEI